MMVVVEAKDVVCWCVCHGKWITLKRGISCYECIELCLKEGAHRIEFTCDRENPPYNEVDYE
jgi:hypothetical protein